MSTLAAILAVTILPPSDFTGVVEDECDRVTLNHYYDYDGNRVFDQLLYEERTAEGFRIRAWRLVKSAAQHSSNGTAIFHDGEVTRQIRVGMFCESWTMHDPEMAERTVWPKELRRGLTRPTEHRSTSTPSNDDLTPN